jgi:hypothetical protein
MIDTVPVLDRLRAKGVANLAGVTSLARLGERPPAYFPVHYVVPEADRGETPARVAGQTSGVFDQRIATRFMVVTLVGGSAADADVVDRQLREETVKVEDALLGWAHPAAEGTATRLESGRLISVANGVVAWAIVFVTERRVRKAVAQ